ncbi:MAG: acyl-CoA dehydrogenase [Pseudomonadota bacterium]
MYQAPVKEIAFTLDAIADLTKDMAAGRYGELSDDLVDAILEEGGKFATDEIAPMHKIGDEVGSTLKDAVVTTPPGWTELYTAWREAGWNSLSGDPEYGGQGLPNLMSVAIQEMWNSGSVGFGLCPTLTIGAVEAIEAHGSDDLKATYLPKMISGEWTGSMNLTEPQSGSDLGGMKTKAVPQGDGTYRISGQKIYITYGEHDMTNNIVHLVLARLPDAPAGTRGISLFVVPKFLVNEDGTPGARNDVFCNGIEHKLGIHASPTCTMIYGDGFAEPEGDKGAIGWLVGEENRGLNCMFTMMNNARLMVGVQGVGIAEAATQTALGYAAERKQGYAIGADKAQGMTPIDRHPDVQRNLVTMKALTAASRAICYSCAQALDLAKLADSAEERKMWAERAAILTPLAKAYSTDAAERVASVGIQVHGGMGFVEETGAAKYLRDSKITQIYEGTNGIQAIDLVMRKLPLSEGSAVDALIADYQGHIDALRASNNPAFGRMAEVLGDAVESLWRTTAWMREQVAAGDVDKALASATPYQELFALVSGGALMAKSSLIAAQAEGAAFEAARIAVARFFVENLVVETGALEEVVTRTADQFADFDADMLTA